MINIETGKNTSSFLHDNGCKEEKNFSSITRIFSSITRIITKRKKVAAYILRKRTQKLKKTFTRKVRLSPSKKFILIDCNESPLKIMKNTFCLILKAFFVLEIFTFLSWLFGFVGKALDKKAMVHFKIHDVKDWTNNYNTHIVQSFKK